MSSSYELHRQSAQEKETAQVNLEAARSLLDEAEVQHGRAAQLYEQIIENAKAEITPELIMEAY